MSAFGVVFLWFFGLAGVVVGGISLLLDVYWQAQLFAFAGSGIALAMLWQGMERPSWGGTDSSDHLLPTCRPSVLVGRVLELRKPIVDGIGMVTIDGTMWRVAGKDCVAGKRVKVIQVEGTLLIVDPVED